MKRHGSTRLCILLLVLSPLAVAQNSTDPSGSDPKDGGVSDGNYTSRFFGFTYKIPQGLLPHSTEFQQHVNDPSRPPTKTYVLFLAATPVRPYKNVAISAQRATNFKDGAAYLEKVESSSKKLGLTVLDSAQQKTIAGTTFFRQDYYSPQGTFFQTHACILSKGYVLDFVISANDRADVEKLFDSLNTLQFETSSDKVR